MFYYHARSITTTDPTSQHMTLSEYILEETNDGIDMARLLIDVMNGFIRGVTPINHRLAAARLLTIYGFQDARRLHRRQHPPALRRWTTLGSKRPRTRKAHQDQDQRRPGDVRLSHRRHVGKDRTHPRRTPGVSSQGVAEPSVRQEPGHTTAQTPTQDSP